MIDFVILYEVEPRELESILLLGNELRYRGYSVKYYSLKDFERYKYLDYHKKLKKVRDNVKVLLVPSCYHDKEILEFYYLPFGKVEKIVNLRWEQYFRNSIMDNPSSGGYLFPVEGAKNAYHISWGNESSKSMIAMGVPKELLINSGPIHMDLLRKEFRTYYMDKSQLFERLGLDSSKKAVLFISSYANVHDRSSYFSYLERFFNGKYKIDYDAIEMEKESYNITLKWIDDFLDNNPDVIFIWRPHPSEAKTDKLSKLEKKHKNFVVISDYSVKQWILTCETIVTWVSTSIIEAYFANKPCFILRPVRYPYEKDMCVYKNANFITTKQQFMEILNIDCVNNLDNAYIHKCYDVDTLTPSYVRLADALENIYNKKDYYPWNDKKINVFNSHEKKRIIIQSAYYMLKKTAASFMIKIKQKTRIRFGHKIETKLEVYSSSRVNNTNTLKEINYKLAPMVIAARKQRLKKQLRL